MKNITRLVILITLLFSITTPIYAADPHLPPLPDWPIIGPVLKWLGIIKPETEPLELEVIEEEILRDIPEYTIVTLDDVIELESIETETSVRVIASEETINTLIAKNTAKISGLNHVTLTLEDDVIAGDVQFDHHLRQAVDIDFPLPEGSTLNITGRATLSVQECRVTADLEKLKINRISVTRFVSQQLDQIIAENWPDDMCIESLTLTEDEIVVEGYRK